MIGIMDEKDKENINRGTVETLFSTYQYIWGIWYPQSGYEIADREDFECCTEKFLGPYMKIRK